MASCPEIEEWLSILGTGIAGLRFLKEYGVRTSELEYFTRNFGETRIEASAFAPAPLRSEYEQMLKQFETKLRAGIQELRAQTDSVSSELIEALLKDAKELFRLLRDMHQAAVSGLTFV
jgi:hypothetical protein